MKRIVIVSGTHQIKKLIGNAICGDTIIATKPEVHKELAARRIEHKAMNDYAAVSENTAIDWIKKWPKKRIEEKNFIQHMRHGDISVWWFMESWLYYSSVYFDSVRDVLLSVQLINSIIKNEEPDEITFFDDGKLHSEIIRAISDQKGIKTTKIRPLFFKPLYSMKRKTNTFFIKNFITFSYFLRKMTWILSKKHGNYGANRQNKKIIFISTYAWERTKDGNGRITIRDPFNTPITEEFEKKHSVDVLSVHIPIGNFLGLKEIGEKSRKQKFTVIEQYGSSHVNRETSKSVKEIRSVWNALKNNENFMDSLVFDGVNISRILEKQFSCYFSTRLKGHMRDYYLIREMIEKEQPNAVVYPGETSEFAKALFHLCRERGIPSVGMQHGMLHKYLGWIHEKNEVNTQKTGPEICPIPDITTVYGPAYKTTLIKDGKYPESSVFVSGSQRFDRILQSKKTFRKEAFLKEHNIDPGKKIITYVTSPILQAHAELMNEALMNALKKMNNTHLIIKLHPSETQSLYEKSARSTGSKITALSGADLYEVLNATDIAVTHLSTAALEAMIFDKPVIVINLTGAEDRVPYVKEGAAFGAYTKEELERTLKALLESKNTYGKKRKAVKKFVYRYAYKTDGRASERIARKIEELLEKKS